MKKVLFVIVVAIVLVIVSNLVRSISEIWQKKDFISQAEQELARQKQENQRLKSELSYSKTAEFIEKQARDKLFMIRKGEQKILIPKEPENIEGLKKDNIPNWRKWWNLFF